VFHWIGNEAGAKFDQIVTAKTGSGASAREASFQVKGEREPSGKVDVSKLVIIFLGAVAAERRAAPTGYASHDFADAPIEEAQTILDPIHRDKLGRINGLDAVPAEERAVVKFTIFQYFRSNPPKLGTRNAEVDAIVPIPNPPAGWCVSARKAGRSVLSAKAVWYR